MTPGGARRGPPAFKASRYNVAAHGGVFNTWTETLARVPASVATRLGSGRLAGLPPHWLPSLLQAGFVVPSALDEVERAAARVQRHRAGTVLQVVAVPDWGCNLCCAYCYEKAGPVATSAPPRHWADALARFIERRLSAGHERALALALFGGEPLLRPSACAELAGRARAAARAAGLPYQCTLTTNGTRLDAGVRGVLAEVDAVQVTLDGPRGLHERVRVGRGGQPTFERILAFLAAARDAGAHLVLRWHLHEAPDDALEVTARDVLRALGEGQDVRVYFSEVSCGSYVDTFADCAGATPRVPRSTWLLAARQRFLDAGWPATSVQLYLKGSSPSLPCAVRCGFLNQRTVLIDPALDVSFCPVAVRDERLRLGHLDADGQFHGNALHAHLLSATPVPGGCQACQFLPLCEGGCPARAVVQRGTANAWHCERERIATLVDDNLRRLGCPT